MHTKLCPPSSVKINSASNLEWLCLEWDCLQGFKAQLPHFTALIHWLLSAQKYQCNLCKLLHKMTFLCVTGDSGPFYETAPWVRYKTVGHFIIQVSLSKWFKEGNNEAGQKGTLMDTRHSLQGIPLKLESGADKTASKYHLHLTPSE